MRLVFLLLWPVLISACVGGGVITTATETNIVGTAKYASLCPSSGKRGELQICKPGETQSYSMEYVRHLWGEPHSQGVKDGLDYLAYNKDVAWRGLLVFALIPIPLVVPVGHNVTTLYFDHDHLVRAASEYGQSTSAVCGLHSEGPNGFGCIAGWH